jgi:DNA-binding Xre family transcriptional regulator
MWHLRELAGEDRLNSGSSKPHLCRGIMAKKWETLRAAMSPERRQANRAAAQQLMAEMPLEELRSARNITQTHLAALLRITQASVSKMEKRTDMYVSTLRAFVQAMGGELEIRAIFPDGIVKIDQFSALAPSEEHLSQNPGSSK